MCVCVCVCVCVCALARCVCVCMQEYRMGLDVCAHEESVTESTDDLPVYVTVVHLHCYRMLQGGRWRTTVIIQSSTHKDVLLY